MSGAAMYLSLAFFRGANEGDLLCEGNVVQEEGMVILITSTGSRFIETKQIQKALVGAHVKVFLRQGEIVVEPVGAAANNEKQGRGKQMEYVRLFFGKKMPSPPAGTYPAMPDWLRGALADDMKDIFRVNSMRDHEKNQLILEQVWVGESGWFVILSGVFPAKSSSRMFASMLLSHKMGALLNQKITKDLVLSRAATMTGREEFYNSPTSKEAKGVQIEFSSGEFAKPVGYHTLLDLKSTGLGIKGTGVAVLLGIGNENEDLRLIWVGVKMDNFAFLVEKAGNGLEKFCGIVFCNAATGSRIMEAVISSIVKAGRGSDLPNKDKKN